MEIHEMFKLRWEKQISEGKVIEKKDGTFVYSNDFFKQALELEGINYDEDVNEYIISDETVTLIYIDGSQKEMRLN